MLPNSCLIGLRRCVAFFFTFKNHHTSYHPLLLRRCATMTIARSDGDPSTWIMESQHGVHTDSSGAEPEVASIV